MSSFGGQSRGQRLVTLPGRRRLAALPMSRHLAALLLLLAGVGLGQQYSVDDSGGPLTLSEDVAAAAEAWNSAAEGVALESAADAPNLITFGDAELMGPDLVSATLTRPGEAGIEVRLNPESYRDHPAALLHELGLLIGLPVSTSGVMEPLLDGEDPQAPSEEDLALLAGLATRVPGDISGDGIVGLEDLALLGSSYGREGINLPADLDGDGLVGEGDLEILRSNYRFAPPGEPDGAGDTPGESGTQTEEGEPGSTEADAEPTDTSAQPGSPETEPTPAESEADGADPDTDSSGPGSD